MDFGTWIELRPFGESRTRFVNLAVARQITEYGKQVQVRAIGDANEYMFDGSIAELFRKAKETTLALTPPEDPS